MAQRLTWLFDLDDTLHDASWRIFATLDVTINDYIERHLGLARAEADRLRTRYWQRYGATLAGLVLHHGVKRDHYLAQTHAFIEDASSLELLRFERGLERMLARLPGRKLLVTNAPARYAHVVLRHIGLHRQIGRRLAIEHMHVHGRLRPKPSRAMLRMLLAREGIVPARAVLVEDSVANLKSAKALGMRTVLVTGYRANGDQTRKSRPSFVDLQVKSIAQLVKRQDRLR
jgi:putative hydrolase of the HAD superfamily